LELKKCFTIGVVLTDHERMVVDAGTLDGTKLIQAVVNDTLDGYILWGYRLALEKDPQIVISLQCLLVACNIVRHIIEGCSIESCLGVSNTFQNYREGVEFLMLLMAAVKEGFDREGLSLDSATSIAVNSNDNVQMQPLGFTKHNLKRKLEEEACFVNNEALVSHICDSALYICCILEKPWCWDAALKHRLISHTQIPIIAAEVPIISATEMDVLLKADDGTNLECTGGDVHREDGLLWTQQSAKLSTQTRSSTYVSGTSTVRHQLYRAKESLNFSLEEESILSAILRAESLREIESLVLKVKKEDQDCSMEADLELGNSKTTISRMQLSSPPTTSFYRKREEISGRSAFRSIFKIGQFAAKETHSEVVNISVDVAAILRSQAFHVLSSRRQSTVAKRLYKLAFATDSNERDSLVMLWLLEHANPAWQQQGVVGIKSLSDRKKLERSDCDVPRNFGLLKYTLLYLVEKELWDDLAEFCQWGTSLLKDLSGMEEKSQERKGFNEGAGNKGKATSGHIRHKRFAQTLKVAKTLGDLIQLCTSLQTATGFNHFNKDVAVMGSTVWQLFEDFMCMLMGVDAESQSQRVDDVTEPHGIQSGSAAPGARTVPLIPHVTNSRVLTSLASLMAGWLHRCHAVGRTTWPLAVERYGVLADVTAGASLPPPVGSLPHAASVYRPVPPRVPPEFGRDLFGVLLEGIVQVPGVLEEDKEKGYRWLQGLADLAFEDEAYVKALQLYLQAGAIRSAHYCDRSSSMPRDVFTPWVVSS
jgi:phage gp36-like protein